MTAGTTPPKPPAPPDNKPIVHQTITLRVDLRVLAALGGALIIVGAFLPWVSVQFQPIVKVLGPASSGGWPILLFGVLAIVLQFWTPFRTPRASLPAAALGFAAGALALASALNTIGVGRAVVGENTVSPLLGVGIGVYLTLAGSLIAILAGLAPQPLNHEPARAELRLWKASSAIFIAVLVVCGLSSALFGSWIGAGASTGRAGTPVPAVLDAGLLATPLINVESNPLNEGTPEVATPESTPIEIVPTEVPPTETLPPTPTPELPAFVPTLEPPTPTPTNTELPPTPTATVSSPIETPTITPTPTITETPTDTPTPTITLTATP